MTEPRTVGDFMTPNPVSISEAASLAEAASVLDSRQFSGLPVVDASGILVGVLSRTDLIRAQASPQLQANWRGLAVAEIMTKPALTIPSTAGLDEAARLMGERRVHRLVVTDAAATPIGIISASDLVRSLLG
ncbi:MAG: CBS domain-containing protein [Candidatus Limnocylindrales bacterium]|jgi:CBS domain-containing protein